MVSRKFPMVFLALSLLSSSAFAADEVVARVGEGEITRAQYALYLGHFADDQHRTPEALTNEEKKRALDVAIEDEMIFQEALSENTHTQGEIRKLLIESYKALHPQVPDEETALKAALAEGLHKTYAARQRIIHTFVVAEGTTRQVLLPILKDEYHVEVLAEDLKR